MSICIEEGAYCMQCDDCPTALNEGELFDSLHSLISAANAANWLRIQSDSGEWWHLCQDCANAGRKVSVDRDRPLGSAPVSGKALLNALLDRGDNAEDLYYAIIAKLDAGQDYYDGHGSPISRCVCRHCDQWRAADALCRKAMEER